MSGARVSGALISIGKRSICSLTSDLSLCRRKLLSSFFSEAFSEIGLRRSVCRDHPLLTSGEESFRIVLRFIAIIMWLQWCGQWSELTCLLFIALNMQHLFTGPAVLPEYTPTPLPSHDFVTTIPPSYFPATCCFASFTPLSRSLAPRWDGDVCVTHPNLSYNTEWQACQRCLIYLHRFWVRHSTREPQNKQLPKTQYLPVGQSGSD